MKKHTANEIVKDLQINQYQLQKAKKFWDITGSVNDEDLILIKSYIEDHKIVEKEKLNFEHKETLASPKYTTKPYSESNDNWVIYLIFFIIFIVVVGICGLIYYWSKSWYVFGGVIFTIIIYVFVLAGGGGTGHDPGDGPYLSGGPD